MKVKAESSRMQNYTRISHAYNGCENSLAAALHAGLAIRSLPRC
jgi:hypothetical protein